VYEFELGPPDPIGSHLVAETTPRRLQAHGAGSREQDAARAVWAADPPGDLPRLWCDEPSLDGSTVVSEQLVVRGWALPRSGGGKVEVEVEVDVGKRLRAHHGLRRTDLRDALPDEPDALRAGWLLRVTTTDWKPGPRVLRIIARDERGEETTLTRGVETDPTAAYRAWLAMREGGPSAAEGPSMIAEASPQAAPRLLVCLVADGTGGDDLARSRRSLESQTYPNWDLVTVGLDASEPGLGQVDDLAAGLRHFLDGERDYVVFARAGDVLAPQALLELAQRAGAPDPPGIIYADSDVLDDEGTRRAPFFKPGWSPELLRERDYIGPFACVARAAARKAVDLEPVPIQSVYELLLRLVDHEQAVVRVPDVLYSAADRAAAGDGQGPARATTQDTPRASIVIPTAFRDGFAARCLESIREQTTYPEYEVVLVGHSTPGAPPGIELAGIECRVVSHDGPFNDSAQKNLGARAASGELLVFVDDDTQVVTPDWIERLLEQTRRPGVAVAGGKLVFADGTLELAGVLVTDGDPPAYPIGSGLTAGDPGYRGLLAVARNASSVGGGFMAVGRDAFAALDGFDEAFAVDFGDVDLCLRAQSAGQRVAWTPRAVLQRQERAAVDRDPQPRDESRFKQRWRGRLEAGDPYYNPNLSTRQGEDLQLRQPPGQPPPADPAQSSDGERPSEERFVPETMGGLIQAEHEGRYRWAATVVAGREVLDAGCGVGYGTEMLAEAGASRVVGLDVSPEAVEDAVFRAGAIGQFEVGDLERMPFSPGSFDVVVCFEAIEHVNRRELALDELRRVLRRDGLLILSSPNRHVYLPGNPYHVHEYTPSELHAALTQRFRHVALYRQHPWITSLITDDAGLGARSSGVEIAGSVRKVVGAAPGEELYTLAVAGDAPLPSMRGTAVLTDAVDLKAWDDRAAEFRTREKAFQAREQALQAEVRAARDALEAMESSVSWRVTSPLRSAKRRLGDRPPEAP